MALELPSFKTECSVNLFITSAARTSVIWGQKHRKQLLKRDSSQHASNKSKHFNRGEREGG